MDNQQTVGAHFKAINILHIALCLGVIFILAILRYLAKQTNVTPESNRIFEIVGVAVSFVCIIAARFLFFNKTKEALNTSSLKEKINIFRAAFIIQMALLEAPALINAVLYFITKNDLHFFVGVGIVLLMIVRRPTRSMAAMTLFTEMEDKQVIYEDSTPV